jgi:hypothetical protein
MTTHMNQQPGQALIDFMGEFIVYLASVKKDLMEEDDGDDKEDEMMEISMFNEYFSRPENKEQVKKLSCQYNLKNEFFVTVCVILSHWMYKLGYCDKVIKIRMPNEGNKE